MGESSSVKAIRLQNQANKEIAHEANVYNAAMMREQNAWNKFMWDEENRFNDSSAQVQRLIEAGINPIYALGSGGLSPGQAEQLTSADAKPAEVAHVEPEYDPMLAQHIGNIVASSRDVVNSLQGFEQLRLQQRDVDTRAAAQVTRSDLDRATALEMRASAAGKQIANDWSLETFVVRSQAETKRLNFLEEQIKSTKAGTEESEARKLNLDETRNLIREQVNSVIAGIKQRDQELKIAEQNARTAARNADLSSRALDINEEQFSKRYSLDTQHFNAQIQQWNNENLLRFMEKFGRRINVDGSASFGYDSFGAKIAGSSSKLYPATQQSAIDAGIVILQRYAENPTEQNQQDAAEASRLIQMIQDEQARRSTIPVGQLFNSTSSSILNPSGSDWQ